MENQILKASSDRTPDLHLSSLALVLKANQIGARTVRTTVLPTVASAKASKNKKEDTNLPLPAWLTT